jgi:hypothetical protein
MWSLHLAPLDLSPHRARTIGTGRPEQAAPNPGPAMAQPRCSVGVFGQAFCASAAKTSRSLRAASVNAMCKAAHPFGDLPGQVGLSSLSPSRRQRLCDNRFSCTRNWCDVVVSKFKGWHNVLCLLFNCFLPEVSPRLTINRKAGSD